MKVSIKIIDIVIILLAAIFIIFSIYSTYIKPTGIAQVLIQGQNTEWIYNLDAEETIIAAGPIGETVVRIGGGCAWVESSPCDNKNCITTGFVRRQGQWAACLPNQVLVMIQGSRSENAEVDAVSR